MAAVITVTGVLTGAPDDWTPKRCDRPVPVSIELESALSDPAERQVVLAVERWRGRELYRSEARLRLEPGLSLVRTTLPPHTLTPGRHVLVAEVVGEDRFRSRHPIGAWLPPGGTRGAAPAGAAGWEVKPGRMIRPGPCLHVEQVRFRRPDGSEPPSFAGGEPVHLVSRFNLDGLPPNPLVRIELFTLDGRLAVGTSSARTGVLLGHGGRVTVAVELERLNLMPGRYLVTVGLWPDEAASEPFEAHHGYHELLVASTPSQA